MDWDLERKKILFLQTALKLGFPWADVVKFTRPFFGQTLYSSPVPISSPFEAPSFMPPAFDIATQTPEQWGTAADAAWKAHRTAAIEEIRKYRSDLIDAGLIKELNRPRRRRNIWKKEGPHR